MHEETERYEAALALILNKLSSSSSSSRSALKNAHIASILVDRIVTHNRSLADFYADGAGLRKEEIDLIASGVSTDESSTRSMADALALFKSRLSHIKSYHEKHPAAPPEAFSLDITALEDLIAPSNELGAATLADPLDRLFSGEEGAGRYLDLYEQHAQYINLKGIKRTSYLNYLDKFHDFASLGEADVKRQAAYKSYLTSLRQYLISYLRKIRPLDDIDGLVRDAESSFETQWEQSMVSGWEDGGKQWIQRTDQPQSQELSSQSSLLAYRMEGAVWCEICHKSFAKQTVFDGHLNGKNHKKTLARQQHQANRGQSKVGEGSKASAAVLEQAKSLAKNEFVIRKVAEGPLAEHRADTRSNVERRAALTERERQAEAEELARSGEELSGRKGDEGDDDDNDDKIYNPKKLPLGWDGRPIPVWLYKLHGLGIEFRCEICSDYVYQGRKNFDRHFTESRHAFGMRALGLPNTKHFHGVTSIEDAMHLAEKLKRQGKEAAAESGSALGGGKDIEEVEDENGNTYSRKDYELLKRQGLI